MTICALPVMPLNMGGLQERDDKGALNTLVCVRFNAELFVCVKYSDYILLWFQSSGIHRQLILLMCKRHNLLLAISGTHMMYNKYNSLD